MSLGGGGRPGIGGQGLGGGGEHRNHSCLSCKLKHRQGTLKSNPKLRALKSLGVKDSTAATDHIPPTPFSGYQK